MFLGCPRGVGVPLRLPRGLCSGLCGADVADGGVAVALGVLGSELWCFELHSNLGHCCDCTLGVEQSPWAPSIVLARVAGQQLPAWLGLGEDSALWDQ